MARTKKQEEATMNVESTEVVVKQDTALQHVSVGNIEGFENVDLSKDIKVSILVLVDYGFELSTQYPMIPTLVVIM